MHPFARRFVGRIALFLFVLGYGIQALAAAGVPKILNHQGRLLDASGNLLGGAGTDYCFKFSIYDDATTGAPDLRLWPVSAPSTMTVNVKSGVFSVGIGDTNAGGNLLDFDFQRNDAVYLNVEVATKVGVDCAGGDETFETLSPRQRILASGYAINAGSVLGAGQSAIGTTTPFAEAVATVEATTTSSVALLVRGFFNQVADLFRVVSAAGVNLLTLTSEGRLGVATSSPGANFSVGGEALVGSAVTASQFRATSSSASVFPVASTTSFSVGNILTVSGAATSTFTGGVFAGGFASSNGLQVSAGDTALAGGLTVTGSSIFPIASSTSFSIANLLQVSGAATSTFTGGITTGGISSSNGLRVSSGDTILAGGLNVTGSSIFPIASTTSFSIANLLNVNGLGTSTYAGALSTGPLAVATGTPSTLFGINLGGSILYGANQTSGNATSTNSGNELIAGTLQVKGFSGSSSRCLRTLADGSIQASASDCGSGGSLTGTGGTDMLSYWTSGTNIAATSSPTAATFTATSTANASSFPIASSTSFSVANVITVSGAATSTFTGGLSSAGLASSNGLRVSAGDTIFAGGLNVTGSSIFPIASTTSFSISNLLNVSGLGTSTFAGALSTGQLAVGTATPSTFFGINLGSPILYGANTTSGNATSTNVGNELINGNLSVKGTGEFLGGIQSPQINITGSGTTTFGGGIQTVGLDSSRGLRVSAGDTILTGGLNVTGSSVFPIASTTSFSIGNVLTVSGAGTSTFTGGLSSAGFKSTSGIELTAGNFLLTGGKIVSTGAGTSTFTGGITTGGISSSNGFTSSAGNLILTGGIINATGAGTSTFSGGISSAGLASSNGIRISAGDTALAGGLTVTGSSIFPIASSTSFSIANLLQVSGAATSSFIGGISTGGLFTSNGITSSAGDLLLTGGKVVSTGAGTSSFSGGVSSAGLASSNGLRVSTGDTILTGGLNVTGSSIFPIASTTSFSISNLLNVAGLGTSTVAGALSTGANFVVATATPTTAPYVAAIGGNLLYGSLPGTGANATSTNIGNELINGNLSIKGGLELLGSCKGCPAGGGGGYNLIKDETISLTARTTLAFLGTAVTCADNAGLTQTECTMSGAGGGVSFASGAADNTVTSNNLIQLQKSGVDVFKVANSGGLSIFSATTDIVKTTTGTTLTKDFSVTGSAFQNVTSSGDLISIDNGAITLEGSIAASSPAVTTSAAMGIGGHVILRDDGRYVIIHGGGLTSTSLWDGTTAGAMSTAGTLSNAVGAGSIALKRPDGRYLIVSGNASAGLSNLFDPYAITTNAAGPAVCAGGAATTGMNALLRPDGKYLIMCGGLAVTSLYDPTLNTITVGPPLGTGTFGLGAHAIARDDGTFLIFKGGGTGTALYNPNPGTAGIGTMTDVTITNAPTIAIGAVSIRRQDGQYLVIPGAVTTAAVYDPKGTTASPNGTFTSQSGAGNGPSAPLGEGAQAVWRQDGNYMLIIGGATVVTTNIVKPGAAAGSQFVTTNAPALSTGGAGVGVTAFMRPNGMYSILKGNGTAMDYYDMQFVVGGNSTGTGVQAAYWESECIDSANINANSVINWNINAEGKVIVETRTVISPAACTTGTYATIAASGDKIKLAAATDNRIQFRVTFRRDLPKFFDQEWGIRKTSQTRYRRTNKDPALYDVGVMNGLALHRTQFDFGNSTESSGPVSINITNNKDKNLGIALEAGVGYGSTISATAGAGGIYNGAFNSNSALTTTATNGTIVMKRPDGKFVVISGNTATANAQLYNPELRTFAALGTTPAAGTGLGALAFKRPDGKFLIVLGNNTNVTSIFDPVANTFTAGPVLTGLAGDGAQVIPLPNGRILIVHGNYLNTTSVYDPIQNIMIAGPIPSTVVGQGSVVIPRPDGTFLFIPGVVTTGCTALSVITNIFDPYTMIFTQNNAPTMLGTGPGAFAFQRNDGLWVIVRGGATASTCAALTATTLYNPVENRMAVGPVLSAAAQRGAHAIPRPDGTWLIVHAGTTALNTTSIYREKALGVAGTEVMGQIGAFIAGPTLVTVAGAGSISFQKDNGKIVTIIGNAGTVVNEYDAGWVDKGTYRTEQFNLGTQLGTDSTLAWRANTFNGISAEVKTATTQAGLQSASSREVAKSGALINAGASDTWLQINFNFVRKFPSYDRQYTDTWYNSGASLSYAQRKIETPTLYEYKVTKDKDVIDLQSDGLSVFRVSSSGDVYTQAGGTINTSGADLAERYTSQEALDFGEVVSIDPQNNHGVKKSLYQYQPDVLGVVSTDPGFVAGAYTKDSFPIALIGRVPVKVSTENGMIRTGDSLTAASVPGHAMKARLAGRVIGKALESLDPEKLEECPPSDFIIPGRKCGVVMMFVNLIDYGGQSVDLALGDWKAAKEIERTALAMEVGLAISDSLPGETGGVSSGELPLAGAVEPVESSSRTEETTLGGAVSQTRDDEVLVFLTQLKEERGRNTSSQSEIFVDRVSAVSQMISPEVIAGKIAAGALSLSGPITFAGGLEVFELGSASTTVSILSDSIFFGRPYFTSDTGGIAIVKKGDREVEITFERDYVAPPIVSATLSYATTTSDEEVDNILNADIRFAVTKRSGHGFTIRLNADAPSDAAFNWIALAIKDAKEFTSRSAPPPSADAVAAGASPAGRPRDSATAGELTGNANEDSLPEDTVEGLVEEGTLYIEAEGSGLMSVGETSPAPSPEVSLISPEPPAEVSVPPLAPETSIAPPSDVPPGKPSGDSPASPTGMPQANIAPTDPIPADVQNSGASNPE